MQWFLLVVSFCLADGQCYMKMQHAPGAYECIRLSEIYKQQFTDARTMCRKVSGPESLK